MVSRKEGCALPPLVLERMLDVASAFNVPVKTIERWRDHLGMPAIRVPRGVNSYRYEYNMREIIPWWVENVWLKDHPEVVSGSPAEKYSPADRKRLLEIEEKKLDLAVKKDQLVPKAMFEEFMTQFCARLRVCGETLGKKFGRDAQSLLNDVIESGKFESTDA